jgi:signal transduction histidine kinase
MQSAQNILIVDAFHPQILLGKAASFLELSRQRQEGKRFAAMLQSSNQVLEVKVKERTARLELSNRALRESGQQLRTLSRKLLSAQEEERKRMAAELHDSIGSSLGAIKFGLEGALQGVVLDAGVRRMVDDVIKMVLHTTEDVRRIMNNLRPPLLDRFGLISTIADFQSQFESICGRIAIRKQILVREEDIPEPLKIVIFRVLQEAFHNMVKYSQATEAHLELTLDQGEVRLRIGDNGTGFELRSTPQGLGLTSMRERVELSGGSFGIQSSPGRGTRIEATWSPGSVNMI